jgi:hypothetical protein
MVLTRSQSEALKLLAEVGEGSRVSALVRRGCTAADLHHLVRGGLVTAERIRVRSKQPSRADFHLRISDTGRIALARHGERSGHGQISLKLVLIVLFVLALLAGMAVGAFIVPHAWGP